MLPVPVKCKLLCLQSYHLSSVLSKYKPMTCESDAVPVFIPPSYSKHLQSHGTPCIQSSALILEWLVWSKYSSVTSQETMDHMLQSSQKKGPSMKSWGTLPCSVTILVYSESKQSIKMFPQPGSAKFLLSPLSRIMKYSNLKRMVLLGKNKGNETFLK